MRPVRGAARQDATVMRAKLVVQTLAIATSASLLAGADLPRPPSPNAQRPAASQTGASSIPPPNPAVTRALRAKSDARLKRAQAPGDLAAPPTPADALPDPGLPSAEMSTAGQ